MHDNDFAALLESPDRLKDALAVRDYVTDFCDDVPRRFLDLLAEEMEAVAPQLPLWVLEHNHNYNTITFAAGTKLAGLRRNKVGPGLAFDMQGEDDDVVFIGPWCGIWADQASLRMKGKLQKMAAEVLPDYRDNGTNIPAWARPAGWPKATEAEEILAVTGDAGRALASQMAAKVVELARALEAAEGMGA